MISFDTLVTISAQEIIRRFMALEQKFNLNNAVVFNGCNTGALPISMILLDEARDVATVNQFVWDNRNVTLFTDQSLFMQATKVFPKLWTQAVRF